MKKTVKVEYPWGCSFTHELDEFLTEAGLFTQRMNTGCDQTLLMYSKEPFKAEMNFDSDDPWIEQVGELIIAPKDAVVMSFSADWKHLGEICSEDVVQFDAIGLNVNLEKKHDWEKNADFYEVTFDLE